MLRQSHRARRQLGREHRLRVRLHRRPTVAILFLVCALPAFVSCQQSPSVFNPQGPDAAPIAALGWAMAGAASFVYGIVIGIGIFALIRRGRLSMNTPVDLRDPPHGRLLIIGGGVVLPVVMLVPLFVTAMWMMRSILTPTSPHELQIEVVGHQWWWEVRYPSLGVVTANEIHIPAGQPVHIVLKSDDVIHSFWVPELAGKTDLIPGHPNNMQIEASHPGVYRGQCAEFCGVEHARMKFLVIAETPAAFNSWAAHESQPAAPPKTPLEVQGEKTFMNRTCASCHTIRGTPANGDVGPDLTHLMSRQFIGAGTLPTTPANVAAWMIEVQKFKPGALMPDMTLSPQELGAITAYLESLK